MRVCYVTMVFPAPAETFASLEVRLLTEAGVHVAVHSLRARHVDTGRLGRERGLADVPCSHRDGRSLAAGLRVASGRPLLAAGLLAWVVRHTWRKPTHLLKSIVLLPRVLQVFGAVERERPDVVHAHWGHYPALVARLVQKSLPDTTVSISLAAYDLRMEYGCSGPVARDADVVRTLAHVNVPHMQRAFGIDPGRVRVIRDGVDLAQLRPLTAGVARIPRRVVTAGRLIPLKAMDDVLRAFAAVRGRWPDASLVVLGDGPERGRLERLAAELGLAGTVFFKGHTSHAEVIFEMARAEVLLLMSRDERLPNVVKEAMACRCACVATVTPGIDELLADGEEGYLVPVGDVAAAAARVGEILSDPSAADALRERAVRHVEREFDAREAVARYQEAWSAAVARRRAVGTADGAARR